MHRFGWDFSIARRGPVSRSTFSAFLAPGYPVRSFTRPGCGLSRLGMTGNRIRRVGARGVATRGTPSRVAGSPPRSRGPASISGSGGPLRCGRSGRRHRQSLWRPAWIFLADARLDEGVVRFFYDSAHGVLGYSPGKRRIVVEKPDGKTTPISSVIAIPNGRDEGACLAWLGSARPVFFHALVEAGFGLIRPCVFPYRGACNHSARSVCGSRQKRCRSRGSPAPSLSPLAKGR
uniref:Uncharacterized protein n=1 Tax=Candidatus Kentrum sp. TC TaxID=2126339 RepID=A0A450Y9W4_9GAMM|nr:MAG: hypothetical protein BECKTC1821E_GA0114239_100243 [Candidatus Kentron sp. TC]